jgi:hypothetical protein
MNIADALDMARMNGGGTFLVEFGIEEMFRAFGREFDSGYLVSDEGGLEGLPDDMLTPQFVNEWVSLTPSIIWGRAYLGLWRDDNGKWSLDATHWTPNRDTAMLRGELQLQRAIWDCAKGEAISIP